MSRSLYTGPHHGVNIDEDQGAEENTEDMLDQIIAQYQFKFEPELRFKFKKR